MIRRNDKPTQPEEWDRAGDLVIMVVARAFGVQKDQLLAKSRGPSEVAFARQAAMYLLHVVFGGTYQETGSIFKRERTTVAYACSLVEDERDDAGLDQKLNLLEDSLDRLWAIERLRAVSAKRLITDQSQAAA